ncbi:MAG TPA: CCA tRNA nucleotidyltransferase [Candidatus Nanoarchaeia archaeon]|nr:CCA tRNA nucleotidyltransferase [Candidatus Nanoarchaeia archaeon]
MTSVIPEEVLSIYKTLEKNGFEVYFVGGCVRNILLKKDVKDWDLTTNATPNKITKTFKNSFYDNEFGTVGIPIKIDEKEKVAEVTTFRTEKSYSPTHRPEKVSWGKIIEEDLSRRDFTINAIALRLTSFAQGKPSVFELIDPYGGEKDLNKKLVKAVGNANERFKEDALRLIRAVRIATELGFKIEKETFKKIKEDASLIQHISKERIRTELLRILSTKNAYDGIMLLKECGLLHYIIPELLEGVGVSQVRPGRHHTEDVFTHNVLSLKFCPSNDPIVKFAALLHDIGKPKVASKDKEGLVIFHNHEIAGAKIAQEICERLKFSKKEKERVVTLIRWHMFSVNENLTDAAIRRFIRRIGVDNVRDMMDLRVGDRLGGGTQTAQSWRLKLFKKKIEEQLKPAPFSINDLAINGNDIMKELNIKPGPKVGKILQKIFEEVDEDLSKNSKEWLIKRVGEIDKMDIKNL